ncbi:MoaD/ThiS family protein [Acidimangrovimonas sediminis]|uniref:MoaD/ThiS family protein n=1 Tax=Acidimangrovimonas sediminis TaxID=2056283 RepID=UPI000C802F41|nr:MoaD/ThiS family protein [Acidimangrovimonas sediminis]
MVKVTIMGALRHAIDGKAEVEVEASTFKELIDKLSAEYPGLKPQIDRGVSLAVDGRIYREAWLTPIGEAREVVLMPYMKGG